MQPFNETVNVCHTPVVRQCGDEPVGPEICSTHYETNCETRYKTYEIEQDEPVCTMELMKKCNNITREYSSRYLSYSVQSPRGAEFFCAN